tara:strand:+ start:134 stop:235 length:102 start_codon:yes stop_codon:yes gene_type:complete
VLELVASKRRPFAVDHSGAGIFGAGYSSGVQAS